MIDSIYQNLKPGTELLYQNYFERVLGEVDVENFTNQTQGGLYDKQKLATDYKIIERIVNEAKEKDNLLPVILQIMLEQYFWADVYLREMEKSRWIYRVKERKNEDFFPDSLTIYKKVFEN